MAQKLKKLLLESFAEKLVKAKWIKGKDEESIYQQIVGMEEDLSLKKDDMEYLAYLINRKLRSASTPVASTRPRK